MGYVLALGLQLRRKLENVLIANSITQKGELKMLKLKSLLIAAGLLGLMASNAFALPAIPSDYRWIAAPFWTPTDSTTGPANGNSQFELRFENASYESDFGLYTVDDYNNPAAIVDSLEVFKYNQEPSTSYLPTQQTVSFKQNGSIFQVSKDGGSTWQDFNKVFGFYFGVHTGGMNDPTADYEYYTWNLFNTPAQEQGIDHIRTAYSDSSHQVLIFLDDQLAAKAGSDRDFNDMVVSGNDLAPVPEPGTIMLLGVGFLGLGFYGRRRIRSNS